MSTDEPRQTAVDTSTDTDDPTYVGVSVGVEHLIVAAPADGGVGTQLVIEGDHIRERHAILSAATTAMQARRFDDPTGEAQLFEAMWHHLRPQVYDAATRAVRHAQRFETPRVVVGERRTAGAPLWHRRTESELGTWLPAALQRAVVEKAREAEVPVVRRAVADARGVCHECGTRGRIDDRELVCRREDCPVRRVARGLGGALRLARQGRR